ncbi:uncharacterized protein LOC135496090 [Lineus longissimus]|uniref:uncharacterized protein LOC135496090 n=1 Tax=Lineus longissimus TaxID=88925 RepID=UPI002B4DACFD
MNTNAATALFGSCLIVLLLDAASAIRCSVCQATVDRNGEWSDDAECMYYPPSGIECGSDRYTDCVTTLNFEQSVLRAVTRDCEQRNYKGCITTTPDQPPVPGPRTAHLTTSKTCFWTCGTDDCNFMPL